MAQGPNKSGSTGNVQKGARMLPSKKVGPPGKLPMKNAPGSCVKGSQKRKSGSMG